MFRSGNEGSLQSPDSLSLRTDLSEKGPYVDSLLKHPTRLVEIAKACGKQLDAILEILFVAGLDALVNVACGNGEGSGDGSAGELGRLNTSDRTVMVAIGPFIVRSDQYLSL